MTSTLKSQQEIIHKCLSDIDVLFDDEQPIPISLTPFVLEKKEYAVLANNAALVMNALEKALELYLKEKTIQNMFPEFKSCRKETLILPPYRPLIQIARFDLAVTHDNKFKLLEINPGCPGGITIVPAINNSFRKTKFFKETIDSYQIENMAIDDENMFINHLRKLGANTSTVAFISSEYRTISNDLTKLAGNCKNVGINGVRCNVQDLEHRKGKLFYENYAIDVAYLKFDCIIGPNNRFDFGIHKYNPSETKGFWEAVYADNFIYVSPFPSWIVAENKRFLTLLFEPEIRLSFTKEECGAIDELVSETSGLSSKEGQYQRWTLKEILSKKDEFVLKSLVDTRGRGIYIGKFLSDAKWNWLINSASPNKYVIQKFTDLRKDRILSHLPFTTNINAYTDIGLYMLAGKPVGFLCRASLNPVVNIANGGALRPTYVIS